MKIFGLILSLSVSLTAYSYSWKERIIEDAKNIYSPVSIKAFNKPIFFFINDSQSVGASAHHDYSQLKVVLDKGLMNSPRLTPDGLRMVICHELGHLFGGAPRRNIPMEWDGPIADDGRSMMSSEGQADYYASMVCFRKMLEIESDEGPKPDFSRVGPRLKSKCEDLAGFKGEELKACLRAGLAGEDFLKLVFEFPISCEQQDDEISPVLIRDSYPGRQCRLDTIVSGALCSEPQPLVLEFNEMRMSGCGQEYALRPGCWYR